MFSFSTIENYHAFLKENSSGCEIAVNHFLTQIENQKHLNAFLEVFGDEALQRAKLLDEKRRQGLHLGKLHGVIIGLKDVICYKGHKLSASSKILKSFTSTYNATVVEKLLKEDAIIIGRQNCDEFAMGSSNENSAFGIVLNAKDNSRVPGGSSGGSAVSVQAGLCMASLGSDTGGSVRQPSDFCGIIGLKPSYGRVSRYGLIAYASSFDQIGILAKSIDDAALILEVISGKDEFDATSCSEIFAHHQFEPASKKYKFCYFKQTLEHPLLDKEIAEQFNSFIKKLIDEGHSVEAIDFNLLDYVVPAYYVLTTAEASSNLLRFDGIRFGFAENNPKENLTDFYKHNRSKGFGDEVKRRILLGTFVLSEGYFDAYFTKAQQVRKLLVEETNKIFSTFDCLLSPVSPTTAFKIGEKKDDPIEMFLADIYTVFANLTGIPAMTIPLFEHENGMPFGVQAMTSNLSENLLIEISNILTRIGQKDALSKTLQK